MRPLGRRPHWGEGLEQHQVGIDKWLDVLPDLQPEEKELLLFLLSQPENLDQFDVCSSFQAEEHHLLSTQLPVPRRYSTSESTMLTLHVPVH